MSVDNNSSIYLNLLEEWLSSAIPYLYTIPDRPELSCYGSGENTWGVQTNQKAFAAFATIAADPRFNAKKVGISKDQLKEIALSMLRFSLQSHIEGNHRCTDGVKWGHTWISVLGLERMMHGVEAIEPDLRDEDRELLRKVLLSESDWLLDHYSIVGGLYNKDGNNKPESNLWNGAFMHRIADMYPDCERSAQYRKKALSFFINSISVPSDAWNETVKDGKKVADRFVGANFFESMALNHHGYLNVGYMVICLSNMAMLHFAYKRRNTKSPTVLYHRMRELWEVVKLCTFPDGRLLRIGGDTRFRYTYCQDYVIPTWLMIKDILKDSDCDHFEERWMQIIRKEMEANGDGTFLSRRGRSLMELSPLYFTRLESDRAVALSMGHVWTPLIGQGAAEQQPDFTQPIQSAKSIVIKEKSARSWHDAYHGAYLHSSDKRIASWVWESAEKPQGLCLPTDASDMAEWKENLSVHLMGLGRMTEQRLEHHDGKLFQGGFITWGSTLHHTQGLLAEGQRDHDIARSRVVCAALPDNTSMVVLQYTAALEQRTYVREVKGLHLLMPNDVFNGNRRTYYYNGERHTLEGEGNGEQLVRTGSNWLNIDDRLGIIAVYGVQELSIYRPGRRQIGLKEKITNIGNEGLLYADEICAPCELGLQSVNACQAIVDAGFVLQAGEGAEATSVYAESVERVSSIAYHQSLVRSVRTRGADGNTYVLLANFGDKAEVVHIEGQSGVDATTDQKLTVGSTGMLEMELLSGAARLIRIL